MAQPRIRLRPDVAKLVQKSAAVNSRSLPKEVNYQLLQLLMAVDTKTKK